MYYTGGKGGGADGSILVFNQTETAFRKSLMDILSCIYTYGMVFRRQRRVNHLFYIFKLLESDPIPRIDDITATQFPFFLQSNLSAGDL
jgi:hypothetical protein